MKTVPLRLVFFAPPGHIHTIRWLSAFVQMGHEVHLVTVNTVAARSIPGVVVHDMTVNEHWPKLFRVVHRWVKVKAILHAVKPDAVHGHVISSCARYSALFGVRPFVVTAWGSDILLFPHKSWMNWLVTRWCLKRADLITVDSEHLKQSVAAFGIPEERITSVQWGADVERIQTEGTTDYLRTLAGVSRDTFLVFSTRMFEPNYNIDLILRAIPRLIGETKKTPCFVFAGDGSLKNELQQLAKTLRIDNHVRFVGRLSHHALEQCYAGADAYISVPESDSTSVSLLEAMVAGLPVVVSDVPSTLEWIHHGWNGYAVPRGNSDAIATSVLQLIENDGVRLEFGSRNAKIAAEKGDHMTNMRKMETIYWQLSGRRDQNDPMEIKDNGS